MEDFINVILGAGGGFMGSLATQVMGIFSAREERKGRQMDQAHELELVKLHQTGDAAEREHEAAIAEMETAADVRRESYEHDASAGPTYRWVNAVIRLVRPVLTALTLSAAIAVIFAMRQADPALVERAIAQLFTMLSIQVSWWFGDQSASRIRANAVGAA